ncbi:MAG: hypothetical protein HDS11_05065 [Bacteroides sp.]|nr:hypothetical protein [Bacteroides sp.]
MAGNKEYFLSEYVTPVFNSCQPELTEWFGYYNYDPLSPDHSKMLMNRTSIEGIAISNDHSIEVGYYTLSDKQWHSVAKTDSFNWQQGAMLQWMPDSNNEIIFNYSTDNHYAAKIIDIHSGKERIIDYPVYAIHPQGKFALGLDYERLYWCRAYHYQPIQKEHLNVKLLPGDGVFHIDLTTNTRRLLVDLKDVVAIDSDADFNDAKHWIEHVMISPDGTKFVFLHRFSYGDVMSYGTRLCMANIDGSNLQVIKGWRNFGWSHFGWCGNDAFAIYTYIAPKIGASTAKPGIKQKPTLKTRLLTTCKTVAKALVPKKLLNGMVGKASYYQFYQIVDGVPRVTDKFSKGHLAIDGHPSFTKDGKYMITDTYSDKKGYQRLLIMNRQNKQSVVLGTFKAALRGNPASCDLHPKLSVDNNYVSIDTAHTGRHAMMLFKINWEKIVKAIG